MVNQIVKETESGGTIFNIQSYSIHDGPGIRTTVFLKGCPLRCSWCQNPESQKPQPEISFDASKCSGCGRCVQVCPLKAVNVVEGLASTIRGLCSGCGECTEICPNEARNLMGRRVTAEEVFKEVMKDEKFYHRSGGGVTLSGGEPLFQPEFSKNVLKLCKDAGLGTAIETCGFANWEATKGVLAYADLVLYDFKHMDTKEHERGTGVSNSIILDNVRKIYHELSIPIWARVPVIPSFNDSANNIEATARFIATELGDSVKIHLLPYHRLGETKYERLEKKDKCSSFEPPDEQQMLSLQKNVESHGLIAKIGG